MFNALFTVALLVTIAMIWRSRKLWVAYNQAHTSRSAVVNQIFMTLVFAAATLALFAVRRLAG